MSVFFDKHCSIWSTAKIVVRWSQVDQETLIYDNILCNFEWSQWKGKDLSNDDIWIHTDIDVYNVTLPIERDLVRKWQIIELVENRIWSIGRFRIDSVLVNESVGGFVDNFLLRCSKI